MKVGVVTLENARSVRTWSGTPFFACRALEKHLGEVVFLAPSRQRKKTVLSLYGKLLQLVTGGRISPAHSSVMASAVGADIKRKIEAADPDAILLLASSPVISGVPDDRPLIYVSDTTFRLITDYYPRYSNLTSKARCDGNRLEQAAIGQADLLLYSSEWAARSAIEDYGADPGKTHVLPFGANLEPPPHAEELDLERKSSVCRLLFIGIGWVQKGAQTAVDALNALHAAGVDATLTICGCTPPSPLANPRVTCIPFLDKSDPLQRARLNELYREADFFILPTRAECYGVVFCEAAAHGVPSIAPATGGVPSAVREGESGHLLPIDATGTDYAELIAAIYRDSARHRALRQSSRAAFEHHLNWDSWGSRAAALIRETAASSRWHKYYPPR